MKPLLPLKGDQCFKKILFLLDETVFFKKFFQTLIHMEAVFWSTKIVFFNESFILASGNGFPLITNLLLLFRVFFLLVDTILEIKCRPFFKGEYYSFLLKLFSWVLANIPASGSSFFRLVETKISSNPLSRLVYADFGLVSNRGLYSDFFFLLLESITEIGCIPVFFNFSVSNKGSSFSG